MKLEGEDFTFSDPVFSLLEKPLLGEEWGGKRGQKGVSDFTFNINKMHTKRERKKKRHIHIVF